MKKYILLTALVLTAGAACTKIETESKKEITFEVANRLQTKADGVKYNNGAFGTYAWFNGSDEFMVNEKVDLAAGVWKTIDHTFYWPKTGSIDFISYSPFDGTSNTAGSVPTVTASSITYTNYTVGTTDLLYADKAKCAANVNEITDDASPESGYAGVPTLFRHALAKLSFKVKANFTEWTDENNEKVVRRALDGLTPNSYIPCIVQGGPGSVFPGVYLSLCKYIDKVNEERFGFSAADQEKMRLPHNVMF